MTGFRRRTFWTVAAAVLILVSAALYTYFVGTRTFLEHAESFAFRRMTVAQMAEEGTYRFFFATNRAQGNVEGTLEELFESQRSESLKFGTFDTKIEPTLGLGMLIDPSDWFLNEEIQVRNLDHLDQEAFLRQLSEQVEASPNRSLLVVVHGFRERFPSALNKTAFLAHVLDINTPVLVFDWPGDQGSSLRGYRRARRVARASGAELAATLKLIVEQVQPDRLWLMANSMGGQVVVGAFHLLYSDSAFSDIQIEFENVVLTAADVDHEEFNSQFKEEIKAMAENLTVYVSSNDRALLVSRIINRGLRLGESTLNRTRNFHNFSLETPEFFDDLFLRFTDTDLPQTRELYFLETEKGARYVVLTRGR